MAKGKNHHDQQQQPQQGEAVGRGSGGRGGRGRGQRDQQQHQQPGHPQQGNGRGEGGNGPRHQGRGRGAGRGPPHETIANETPGRGRGGPHAATARGESQGRGRGGGRGRDPHDQRGGGGGRDFSQRGGRGREGGRGRGGNQDFSVNDDLDSGHAQNSSGVDSKVLQFCKSLGNTPFLLTRQNLELWEASFELAPQYPSLKDYIPKLLKAYLRFPDQQSNNSYAPKPNSVLNLLIYAFKLKIKKLQDAKLVHEIVVERLRRSSSMSRIVDKNSTLSLIRALISAADDVIRCLFQLPGEDMKSVVKFASIFTEDLTLYEREVQQLTIVPQDPSGIAGGGGGNHGLFIPPALQWTSSPTIDWLMNGSLYKKMSLKSHYSDAEDYVETVRNIWTMLTFYWGTAALWPKCTHQSQSGVGDTRACGTPLLTDAFRNDTCTKRGDRNGICGKPAVWRCMRRGHDAICESCLFLRQRYLLGPSGMNGSTDIYDAMIQSIQLQGDAHVLHLKDLMSRKPPKEAINWRTSYRLQPSMLVGIIHLNGRNLELKRDMKIHWGELIAKNKKNEGPDESKRRHDGQLSIRLLSRSDCPDLMTAHDLKFSLGSHVAVIDMRVFVPEVMTVLSTLGQKSFIDGLSRVAFSKYLLTPEYSDERHGHEMIPLSIYSSPLREHLELAFQMTSIDCIATFSQERKTSVIGRICKLGVVQTLDRTQREAFVNALLRPLHCTQGPPGTGKSYVGVCLVLSLMIIRNELKSTSTGGHVGPILALSYKNHAIDEFLVDVLHQNPTFKGSGHLIRLGKPENEELLNFTEKHSSLETRAHRELESRLATLKKSYGKLQQWLQSRDIAVKVDEQEIAQCLIISLLYLLKQMEKRKAKPQITYNESDDDDEEDDEEDEDDLDELNFSLLHSLLLESMNHSRLETIIPKLCNDVDHWRFQNEESRSLILLGQWLLGNVPPPRCKAHFNDQHGNQIQCNEALALPLNGVDYCVKYHSCHEKNCTLLRSPLSSAYCDQHRCQTTTQYCANIHLPNLPFCSNHCCVVCLVHEREVGEVCHEHCCTFPNCSNATIGNFNFCHLHCCQSCLESGNVSQSSQLTNDMSLYCKDLHRCRYPLCSLRMEYPSGYCKRHTCEYCDDCVVREGLTICFNHQCQYSYEECFTRVAQSTTGRVSKYCETHTCRYCVANGNALDREVSLPSYTCYEHVLCTAVFDDGSECMNLASEGSSYCPEHGTQQDAYTSEYCAGITKKGKPCRSKRPSDCILPLFYCKDHLNQEKKTMVKVAKIDRNLFTPLTLHHHQPQSDQSRVRVQPTCHLSQCCVQGCHHQELLQTTSFSPKKQFYCKLHTLIKRLNSSETESKQNDEIKSEILAPIQLVPSAPLPPHLHPHEEVYSFDETKEIDYVLDNVEGPQTNVGSNNLDEMDLENPENFIAAEEEEEDEIPEHTKHFDEIYQEEADETTDAIEADAIVQDIDDLDLEESVNNLMNCLEWDWQMSKTHRQKAVFQMVTSVCRIIIELTHSAERYVDEARQLKAEASAHILKDASVIGGTVVGAAKRLAALRAAEPFAIIVEEACEVMEPTLVAVLAVESVKKLELIGDHRQLPAFVNQCWYNLESSIPSIKTSLFERIIMTEKNEQGKSIQRRDNICSILDIQRRMRTSISNLTKGEYRDLVAIEDHPATQTQKIGDKASVVPSSRKYWEFQGRSVPGLQSCVYFWDLQNNTESRPIAGLSACNENEALAIVELVKYLKLCGIPDECITIITPYDGQKRLLIQLLRKHHCLPGPPKPQQQQQQRPQQQQYQKNSKSKVVDEKTIRVSTVDRYQGDENDIVILSLVRTRPGNRFVGLLNRFIVASSRARLGFYIVGSLSAVEGPEHWNRFVHHISSPDTSGCDSYQQPRVGPELPICCPLHHHTITKIPSVKTSRIFPSSENWKKFCYEKCMTSLGCGHSCQLQCHMTQPEEHNPTCEERVPRPCSRHQHIPLICHTIPKGKDESALQALRRWRCDHTVAMELDCGHVITLKCCEEQDIRAGRLNPPRCELLTDDFIQPSCGHVIKQPKCYLFHEYLASPPRCDVKVTVKRSCGHKRELKCYQAHKDYYEALPCKEVVRSMRPRCRHPFNLRCQDHQQLSQCLGEADDKVKVDDKMTIVEEGKDYGPSETSVLKDLPACCVEVQFLKPCGHPLSLQCDKAFQYAVTGTPKCEEKYPVRCLLCGGSIEIPCHNVAEYNLFFSQGLFEGFITRQASGIEAHEWMFQDIEMHEILNFLWKLLKSVKCKSGITLKRSCHLSHETVLSCFDILKMLVLKEKQTPICNSPYPRELACGHSVEVKCSQKDKALPFCQRPNIQEYVFDHCQHKVKPKTCGELQRLKNDPRTKCSLEVCHHLYRCHHPVTVKCSELLQIAEESSGVCLPHGSNVVLASEMYCSPCSVAPICRTPVSFEFDCGHQLLNVPCCDAFDWSDDCTLAPSCSAKISSLSPLCGHELLIECSSRSVLENWEPWLNQPLPESVPITLGADMTQVISYPPPFPLVGQDILKLGLKCLSQIGVHFRDCGHSRVVACHEAYNNQIRLLCNETVQISCNKCSVERKLSCHDLRRLSMEEITMQCQNRCDKLCQTCGITFLRVPCNQIEVNCNKLVTCLLQCGHEAKWNCGTDEDPRLSFDSGLGISSLCKLCSISRWQRDNDLELDASILLECCRRLFADVADVGQTCTIIEETVLLDLQDETALKAYETARHQLLAKLQEAIRRGESKIIFPPQCADVGEYVKSNYRLVYLPIPQGNNPDVNQLRNRLQPDATTYGRGKAVPVFLKDSLSKLVGVVNGQAKVCLGLAFQAQTLRNTPPFSVGIGSEDLRKRANKTSVQYGKQGYDSVEIEKEDSVEMIYWTHTAIVPLFSLKLQLHTSCPICGDYFSRSGETGVVCANSHFQCYGCFRDYLEAAKQPDAINTYINNQGEVTCPECRNGYSLYQLTSGDCPKDIFDTVQSVKLEHELRKNAALVRQEAEQVMKAELERIQRMTEEQREVHIRRQKIITDILTPKCPRCNQAFIDFTGCFALTCGNNQCRCGFCAWCFQDCGPDAHGHVPNCHRNPRKGEVYGDVKQLNPVWNLIRKEKINEELRNCDGKLRKKILESLVTEFRDINLVM